MENTAVVLQDQGFGARMGDLMKASEQFAKSAIVPSSFRGKPADVFVALEWGTELGMQPMAALQNIYVVNGRPTLSAQSMAGLVKGRADYRGMKVESSATKARVTIKRALPGGSVEENVGEFTIEQARAAGLTGKDNWKAYPQQMLEARAIAFAIRKAYPDVMAGIYSKEEVEDFDVKPLNITPEASATIGEPNKPADPAPTEPEKPVAKKTPRDFISADCVEDYDKLMKRAEDVVKAGFITEADVNNLRAKIKATHKVDAKCEKLKAVIEEYETLSSRIEASFAEPSDQDLD